MDVPSLAAIAAEITATSSRSSVRFSFTVSTAGAFVASVFAVSFFGAPTFEINLKQ